MKIYSHPDRTGGGQLFVKSKKVRGKDRVFGEHVRKAGTNVKVVGLDNQG